jgi:mRNA interferase RelE/StbE
MINRPNWRVVIMNDPAKVLGKLPKDLINRIRKVVDELANEPLPAGTKKLVGHENIYRIRVGDWRISYAVEQERLIILILEISPRGGAYRTLQGK